MSAHTFFKWTATTVGFLLAFYLAAGSYLINHLSEDNSALREFASLRYKLDMDWESIERVKGVLRPYFVVHGLQLEHANYRASIGKLQIRPRPFISLLDFSLHASILYIDDCTLEVSLPDGDTPAIRLTPPPVQHLKAANCLVRLYDKNAYEHEFDIAGAALRRERQHWQLRLNAASASGGNLRARADFRRRRNAPADLRGHIQFEDFALSSNLDFLATQYPHFDSVTRLRVERLNGDVWLRQQRGAGWLAQGDLDLEPLQLDTMPAPLARRLQTRFRLHWSDAKHVLLEIPELTLDYDREEVEQRLELGVALSLDDARRRVFVKELALDEAVAFFDRDARLDPGYSKFLAGLTPEAQLHDLRLDWPEDGNWQLKASVRDLRMQPHKGLPGVSSISGDLHMDKEQGRLDYAGDHLMLHFKKLYPPRKFAHASGTLLWKVRPSEIEIHGTPFRLCTWQNDEFTGNMRLRLHKPSPARHWSPSIELTIQASDLKLPGALEYIPLPAAGAIPDWLLQAATAGNVEDVTTRIDGPLAEARHAELNIRSEIQIADATLRLPANLNLNGINGSLGIAGTEASGEFQFSNSHLEATDWGAGTAELELNPEILRLDVDSANLSGNLRRSFASNKTPIQLNLETLSLPDFKDQESQPSNSTAPSTLPSLPPIQVGIDHLLIGDQPRGSAHFDVTNSSDTLWIKNLLWQNNADDFTLRDGRLSWIRRQKQRTQVQGRIHFCNWGTILKAKRCFSDNAKRNNKLSFDVRWPNAPHRFGLAGSEGSFDLRLRAGNFSQTRQPGITRFVELFNLDTLFRKGGANFGALASAGLSFTKGRAHGDLHDGKLLLGDQGFTVTSSSGRYHLSGVIDLRRRTMVGDLNAILPVAENIGWATLALGSVPQVALGSWVISRLLRRELDQLFTSYFSINGPWDNLEIKLIRAESENR